MLLILISISLLITAGCYLNSNIANLSSNTESNSKTPESTGPATISYTNPSSYFVKGTAITPISPLTLTGSPKSITVFPELPAGLSIDSKTGVISGTPTVARAPGTYTISANATDGSLATAQVTFEIAIRFTVISSLDSGDQTVGDEVCANSGGNCTLRAAFEEAAALTGILSLIDVGGLTFAPATTLTINSRVILTGQGSSTTIITGSNTLNKVLSIGNYEVSMDGFRVQNGRDTSSTLADGIGIASISDNLTLKNCTITGNTYNLNATSTTVNGVGLNATANATTGKILIDTCTISSNTVTFGASNSSGGAKGAGAYLSAGSVIVKNATIQGNNTTGGSGSNGTYTRGGGLYITAANSSVTASNISTNLSVSTDYGDQGGALYYAGTGTTALIDGLICNGNRATNGGGCLMYSSTAALTINNSSITNNIDNNSNGGGIAIRGSPSVTITNSYFETGASGTTLLYTYAFSTPTLLVKNSTLNATTAGAVHLYSNSPGGTSTFENCTLLGIGNSVPPFTKSVGASTLAYFKNTIIEKTGTGTACTGSLTGVTSLGYNISRDNSCTFFSSGLGDISNTDPQVSAPANNGGTTFTAALAAGSPARNAIPLVSCLLNLDQRGLPRPSGALCDMGAYEY